MEQDVISDVPEGEVIPEEKSLYLFLRPNDLKAKILQVAIHERYGWFISLEAVETNVVIPLALLPHEAVADDVVAEPERMVDQYARHLLFLL